MIVWIPMLPEDNKAAACASAGLSDDPRVDHFYDPEKSAGRAIARCLGGVGEVAWDVYLVYPPHITWEHTPPPPSAWAHQLRRSAWAERARYHVGGDLISELHDAVMHLRRSS
jgi:hypothetical protein